MKAIVSFSKNSDMVRITNEVARYLDAPAFQGYNLATIVITLLKKSSMRKGEVYIPSPSIQNFFFASIMRLLGWEIKQGIHDCVGHDRGDKFKVALYNSVMSIISSEIFLFSKFSQAQYHTNVRFSKDKSNVFYFGSLVEQHPELPKDIDVLLFGRLKNYSGVKEVCELARGLKSLNFVVAGRNANEVIQSELANLTVISRYLTDRELGLLLSRSKVVLLPYHSATQSGAIPLAVAHNCAVVGYDVGGLREQVFSHPSFFAKAGSAEILSMQIEKAIAAYPELNFDWEAWLRCNLKSTTL